MLYKWFYDIIKLGIFKEAEMKIIDNSNKMIEIIKEATSVFLVAHKDLDLDAINSCIGIDVYLKKGITIDSRFDKVII